MMKTFMNHVVIAFTTLCVVSAVRAQSTFALDQRGEWSYQYYTEQGVGGYRSELNYSLSKEQLASFKKKIQQIVDCLRNNPTVNPPMGFEPTVQGSVWADANAYHHNPVLMKDKIAEAEIILQFCPLYKNTKTGKVSKGCIEVSHLDVLVNNVMSAMWNFEYLSTEDYQKTADNTRKEKYLLVQQPTIIKTIAPGIVVYDNGSIVISDPDVPLFVPITVKDYFDLAIPYWEKQAKADGNDMVLDYVKKDKAAFTAEELKMPAYFGPQTNSSMILVTSRPTEKAWMKINPAYFDKSLPRSAVQLIVIRTMVEAFVSPKPPEGEVPDSRFHYLYTKAMDVQCLAKLLDR